MNTKIALEYVYFLLLLFFIFYVIWDIIFFIFFTELGWGFFNRKMYGGFYFLLFFIEGEMVFFRRRWRLWKVFIFIFHFFVISFCQFMVLTLFLIF